MQPKRRPQKPSTQPASPVRRQATPVPNASVPPSFHLEFIGQRANDLERNLRAGRPATDQEVELLHVDWSLLQEARLLQLRDPRLIPEWNLRAAIGAWYRAAATALELAGMDSGVLHTTDGAVRAALFRLETISCLRPPAAPPSAQLTPAATAKPSEPTKRGGSQPRYSKQDDSKLYRDWIAAKVHGSSIKDFAKTRGLPYERVKQALDRARKRN